MRQFWIFQDFIRWGGGKFSLATSAYTKGDIMFYYLSRIRGVVANYLASQARDPGIDSHQHQKDSWHISRHLREDIVFSCNLRCLLICLHGRSRTYHVASLRAGPVGRISYNLYFDCKLVRYVTCDLINEYIYIFFLKKMPKEGQCH